MHLNDFDFDLPDELIATRPVNPRSAARLLVANGRGITDSSVTELGQWLRPGDRLVLNDTKVIPARLTGYRTRQGEAGETRAKIELTLLSPTANGSWNSLVKPLKKVNIGEVVEICDGLRAELVGKADGQGQLRFNLEGSDFDRALEQAGAMPLPPYIAARRAADAQDKSDYQTVFARNRGAVAAPTASLHFDTELLTSLRAMGIDFTYVTLHVGAGTFLPVKVEDIARHKMHAEWGEVSADAVDEILATKAVGGRIIPVGTTALRLIESAAREGRINPWSGETDIFIYPGFKFQLTDALMTNFHLPCSTLMMLVSALIGHDRIKKIYAHAIAQKYRFFSYGDASLLVPGDR